MHADPDPTFHPDVDPDSDLDPSFQIKSQTLEKVLKKARIPCILTCRLQIDADTDPDPAYRFDANPYPDFYLMRIRINKTGRKKVPVRCLGNERQHSKSGLQVVPSRRPSRTARGEVPR
jgi:hypothetical protein